MKLRDACRRADAALRLGAIDYAGDVCEHVLRTFPNDVRARTLLAQACLERGKFDEACPHFDHVLELDPEHLSALVGKGVAHGSAGQLALALRAFERAFELNPGNTQVCDSLARLYAQRDGHLPELSAAPAVAVVRWQLRHGDLDTALDAANQFLASHPADVCVQLSRVEALWRGNRRDDAERGCRQLLARHPRLLKPRLILGQLLSFDLARETEGVEILHTALAEDACGVVAEALFRGNTFVAPILWDDVVVPWPTPQLTAPPEVEAAADLLPPASADEVEVDWQPPRSSPNGPVAETAELPGRATTVASLAASPSTAPASSTRGDADAISERLLVVSCRGPLVARYGVDGVQRIERRLQSVTRELAILGVSVDVAFVDDPGSMAQHELPAAASTDANELKRAIDDLDQAIARGGKGVDGILILGGDQVVPFFRLANPSDDEDVDLPSDNPYGVLAGGSLYAPEIPVGRLPDGDGSNPSLLLRQIDALVELRRRPLVADSGPRFVQAGLAALGAIGIGPLNALAFSCAAANWETVAQEAFSPIAPSSVIRSSPPASATGFNSNWIAGRRFFHVDLHGVPDKAAWYGQDCAEDASDVSPLPIAMTPDVFSAADHASPIAFVAASHGAQIFSRGSGSSIALRLLSEGATGIVGALSTVYGSVEPPLAGADLLARLFWENLRNGDRVGVALQRAKRDYIRDVVESQGHLDGDDQKTLLQFVLYGDPLMPVFPSTTEGSERADVALPPSVAYLCNRTRAGEGPRSIAPALLRAAIEQVVDVCPETAGGSFRVYRRLACVGNCAHPGHRVSDESTTGTIGVSIATARQELTAEDGTRVVKIARATLDESGDVSKFVVSR